MQIINSIEDFVLSIPTAQGTEWEAIEPFVLAADDFIISTLTGSDLYNYITAITDDANNLKSALSNIIAFRAYREAIPFVDLIQTPNGFGVVSNANVAPASKERVERLMAQCEQQLDSAIDMLIFKVMGDGSALTEWSKFSQFEQLTNCLFLTGIDFAEYSGDNSIASFKRKAFILSKNKMVTAQTTVLSPVISQDLFDELILQNRTNSLTTDNRLLLYNCKEVLCRAIEEKENSQNDVKKLLNQIAYQLEKQIDKYPTYAASAEYALKIAPKYVNKQSDPVYFF